jgi:hypothetical protein
VVEWHRLGSWPPGSSFPAGISADTARARREPSPDAHLMSGEALAAEPLRLVLPDRS